MILMFTPTKAKKRQKDLENLLMNQAAGTSYAESYRTLRTNLFFSLMEKNVKSVVVTSSVESEGKTNTAVNLGYAIAQTDQKVLLIDADLRRPHLSALFNAKKETGLTGLISKAFGISLNKGTLETYHISDLVQLIRLQSKTCCLNLESPDIQVSLSFESGRIKDMVWKNRPESQRLASTLIKDNLITQKEAALALGHQQKSVRRLGTILQTMGFVSRENIAKALSVQAMETIRAISRITAGTFAVTAHVPHPSAGLDHYIDADTLYGEFSSTNGYHYLAHAIDAAVHPTQTPNLYLLPSGRVPPNPSEVLGSFRAQFLIDQLKAKFDFIIIDAPPVMPVTDVLVIAPRTDGALFVIKSGHTDRKIIQDVLDQFEKAHQPVIGAVLNRVNMQKEGYYRYYKKYYSSYYKK